MTALTILLNSRDCGMSADQPFAVVKAWGEGRAIIDFRGAYIMVDRRNDGLWEISGIPARPGDELELLTRLVRLREGTTVLVTKDGT
jgi:hypothetical protein